MNDGVSMNQLDKMRQKMVDAPQYDVVFENTLRYMMKALAGAVTAYSLFAYGSLESKALAEVLNQYLQPDHNGHCSLWENELQENFSRLEDEVNDSLGGIKDAGGLALENWTHFVALLPQPGTENTLLTCFRVHVCQLLEWLEQKAEKE